MPQTVSKKTDLIVLCHHYEFYLLNCSMVLMNFLEWLGLQQLVNDWKQCIEWVAPFIMKFMQCNNNSTIKFL